MIIVLPGKKYSFGEIAAVLVRRRWVILLPFAVGLPAISATESNVTSVAGPLGGLLVGVLLVAVLEYRDSTFVREEDAARVLMLPVLGTVPVASEQERRRRSSRTALITAVGYIVVLSAIAVFLWGLVT